MPTNATLGSTIVFTVEFFDSNSNLTVPTSATLTISYPPSSNNVVTATAIIAMTPAGSFFTATWGSGVAAFGITNYSVSAPGQASATTGQLRLTS